MAFRKATPIVEVKNGKIDLIAQNRHFFNGLNGNGMFSPRLQQIARPSEAPPPLPDRVKAEQKPPIPAKPSPNGYRQNGNRTNEPRSAKISDTVLKVQKLLIEKHELAMENHEAPRTCPVLFEPHPLPDHTMNDWTLSSPRHSNGSCPRSENDRSSSEFNDTHVDGSSSSQNGMARSNLAPLLPEKKTPKTLVDWSKKKNKRCSDSPSTGSNNSCDFDIPAGLPASLPNFSLMMNKVDDGLSDYVWFHGTVSRQTAEMRLRRYNYNGMFLIRNKTNATEDVPYSLSVYHSGKVYHLQIRRKANRMYAMGISKNNEMEFAEVQDIVKHHRTHSLQLVRQVSGELAVNTFLTTAAEKN